MNTHHPPEKVLDIQFLMEQVLPGRTYLGAANGKPAFGYAMTTLCPKQGAHDSFMQQFKIIDVVGRCYGYRVELEMIFLDIAASSCEGQSVTTNRFGRKQLLIACKSPMYDEQAVLMQSLDRLSRMPDELDLLKRALAKLGKSIYCSTMQPAISVAEVEASMGSSWRSGHPL
jgi:hypothetical protein